jgi:hypothetical protein
MNKSVKTYSKRNLKLKEDVERNYAASTDSVNSTPSQIVNDTKAKHSDATAVTIDGNEMDGNASTQTATVEVGNTPNELNNAQRMARTLSNQGINTNFKVNLNNSKEVSGELVESVTFCKGELSKFLRSL